MGNRLVKKRIKQYNNIKQPDDIPFYSFCGETDLCWVTKCYDGDSIHVIRVINKKPYKIRCRLSGIDTAEIRSHDNDERELAIKTRDLLRGMIYNQYIWVSFGDFDKYGRVLCHLYTSKKEVRSGTSVNKKLIDMGHALAYDGGTKGDIQDLIKRRRMRRNSV